MEKRQKKQLVCVFGQKLLHNCLHPFVFQCPDERTYETSMWVSLWSLHWCLMHNRITVCRGMLSDLFGCSWRIWSFLHLSVHANLFSCKRAEHSFFFHNKLPMIYLFFSIFVPQALLLWLSQLFLQTNAHLI